MGLNGLETHALQRLRRLPRGEGEPLQTVLIGLGTPRDFRRVQLLFQHSVSRRPL
jgi:hypothetical protein